MTRNRLADLARVTEALYQKQYQSLRPVLEAEARIQAQLSRLNIQVEHVRQDSADAEGYRVSGTDILWNGWESATRRQLNTELARVRAQKLTALDQLRHAFGRKPAVESLIRAERAEQRLRKSATASST